MNILVSTTLDWNPGDEFIRYGVLHLFEKVYGTGHNYFYWNRNPDFKKVKQPLSNSFNVNQLDIDHIDLLLIAGSPDWYSDSYAGLYEQILEKNIPILAIGIGSPFENITLTKTEQMIFARENTLAIARDPNVAKHIKCVCLPCPALFSSPLTRKSKTETLLVTQTYKTVNQSISNGLFSEVENWQGPMTVFYKECFFDWQHKNPYYSANPEDLLRNISQHEKVISTRLHGAIASLASGSGSVLLSDESNFRIVSAQKEFGPMLPIAHTLEDALRLPTPTTEEISEFKNSVEVKYIELLQKFKTI